MATHDYVIDNSTGANVRADINLVLQAILSNNSSSSAPSTTAAYMWWADTTTGILKIRNSANDGWVELLQLDGTLTLEDGSASTPGLAFRDDLNTGIFSSAADTFNVATGGVERMELGTTTIFNDDGADVDFRIEGDTDANNFYLDAGNNAIGIGTSTPLTPDGSNADNPNNGKLFTIYGGSPAINLIHNTSGGSAASSDYSAINFGRTGSTTNPYRGIIGYKQSTDEFRFATQNIIAFDVGTIGTDEKARFDSSGRFLIGTTTEGFATADDFTIAGSGDCGMTIRSGTSSQSIIAFSDATSGDAEFAGQISYYHSTDEMVIGANTKQTVKIHDEHINVFAAEGTSRVNLGFSDTLGAELSLYDDTGAQKTRITGSTDTHHFFNNGGHLAVGHNSPSYTLDIRRNASSGGRMMLIGSNGTHYTSGVSSDTNGLVIFRARIEVAANTTTSLVHGYGGNLVIITMQNNGGDDVQQTRIRTNGWNSTSELFFNTYGSNQPTVTFSTVSGVLKVNHQHTGPIYFNVTGLLVSGPQSV